jgi:hypothetical protein
VRASSRSSLLAPGFRQVLRSWGGVASVGSGGVEAAAGQIDDCLSLVRYARLVYAVCCTWYVVC